MLRVNGNGSLSINQYQVIVIGLIHRDSVDPSKDDDLHDHIKIEASFQLLSTAFIREPRNGVWSRFWPPFCIFFSYIDFIGECWPSKWNRKWESSAASAKYLQKSNRLSYISAFLCIHSTTPAMNGESVCEQCESERENVKHLHAQLSA